MDLQDKVRQLPAAPGVYLFKDATGTVVYVGKAKSLRARVKNYFAAGRPEDAKTGSLVREAVDLDFIVVDNEREALALENNLIKRIKPRFNVLLRDDKTYPYIRLTRERWPRVYVTRRLAGDKSEYFGPYFPASLAHRLVRFVHRYFKIPSCRVDLTRFHPRPCLEYHIHRCLGPCVEGLTSDAAYQEAVQRVRMLLGGKHAELSRELRRQRDEAAAQERFEEAAACRDLLAVVEDAGERQKMARVAGDDADVIGVFREHDRAVANLFHVRHGRVVDRREFFWERLPAEDAAGDGAPAAGAAALLGPLVKQLYLAQPYVPPLILLPEAIEDVDTLAEALAQQSGERVEIAVPQRGAKRAFVELAARNAEHLFRERFRATAPPPRAIAAAVQDALDLPQPPRRIECFDISHFQGSDTVASMVVWEEGGMKKADYRKFIVRGVPGIDDFRAMEEVVGRRYRRLQAERVPLPSLVLVDGGIGQLHSAERALDALGITAQPLAAIAKREEVLYIAGRESQPLALDHHSPVLHLIQMLRNEAHRFAVTFHRQRRQSRTLRSPLLDVPGVGAATARRLLRHFGSLEAVRAAEPPRLGEVLNPRQVAAVWAHLHPAGGSAQPTSRSGTLPANNA